MTDEYDPESSYDPDSGYEIQGYTPNWLDVSGDQGSVADEAASYSIDQNWNLDGGSSPDGVQEQSNGRSGGGFTSFAGGDGSSGSGGTKLDLSDNSGKVAKEAAAYNNKEKSSGGGNFSQNSNSSQSSFGSSASRSVPTKALPSMGEYGTVPLYDENRVKALQQKKAATGLSRLRSAVSEALTRSMSSDNPYLRKMLMKGTLEGFGSGMGGVMDSADNQARNAYAPEYQGKLTEYQANINRVNTMFQAAMQDYMGTMSHVTDQSNTTTASSSTSGHR
jgi:hypothetical protein